MTERVYVSKRELTWRGTFIVLMSTTNNLIWGGVYKSLGVLLPTLRDQFTTHTWVIGIVASLMACGSALSGLLARPIVNKLGGRRSLIACNVALACGLMCISFAPNPIFIALMAGLVGASLGIVEVVVFVLTGRHFTNHFGLACGIGHIGGSMSLFIFAPLTQLFLDTYGWRGAVILIAAICCHSIPCAMLITDEAAVAAVPECRIEEQHNNGTWASLKTFLVGLHKKTDMGILFTFKYWIIFWCRFGVTFSNSAWLIYYVPHLEDRGFSSQLAASLCSAAAVGYFFGTFIWSPFIDRGYVRCTTALIVSSLMLSLSFIVDPWVNSVVGYVFDTFLCGLFISEMFTLTDILTKNLYEIDRLANACAWVRAFLVVADILSGFVPGWLYDTTGGYDMAFIIVGCVPIAGLLPLILGLISGTV